MLFSSVTVNGTETELKQEMHLPVPTYILHGHLNVWCWSSDVFAQVQAYRCATAILIARFKKLTLLSLGTWYCVLYELGCTCTVQVTWQVCFVYITWVNQRLHLCVVRQSINPCIHDGVFCYTLYCYCITRRPSLSVCRDWYTVLCLFQYVRNQRSDWTVVSCVTAK